MLVGGFTDIVPCDRLGDCNIACEVCRPIPPHPRCAALRCHVLLCLRDGGQHHLARAAAVLRAALYGTADGPTGQPLSPAPSQQHSARGKPRRDQQAKQSRIGGAAGTGGEAVELQRQAVQGLVDLAVTWGVGLVDKALAAAVEAAARRRRVDAVAERLAAAGLEGGDGQGDGEEQQRDGGSREGLKARDAGVVRTLLRFTDGMVRVLQVGRALMRTAVSDHLRLRVVLAALGRLVTPRAALQISEAFNACARAFNMYI